MSGNHTENSYYHETTPKQLTNHLGNACSDKIRIFIIFCGILVTLIVLEMLKMTSDYHVSTNGLARLYLTNLSEITDFKGTTHLDPLAKGAFTKDVRPTPPRGGLENPDKTGRGWRGGRVL